MPDPRSGPLAPRVSNESSRFDFFGAAGEPTSGSLVRDGGGLKATETQYLHFRRQDSQEHRINCPRPFKNRHRRRDAWQSAVVRL